MTRLKRANSAVCSNLIAFTGQHEHQPRSAAAAQPRGAQ